MKYKCPCCKKNTLREKPPGTFEICSICGWEDDNVQYNDPTYKGGANEISLEDARKRYINSTKHEVKSNLPCCGLISERKEKD